jgi:hypothetical protein
VAASVPKNLKRHASAKRTDMPPPARQVRLNAWISGNGRAEGRARSHSGERRYRSAARSCFVTVCEQLNEHVLKRSAAFPQSIRIGTATATTLTTVLIIEKSAMLRLLRDEPTFSERFISYMLARNIRIEADLVDHLFNSSEKRLARALLLLARYGDQAGPERRIPKISQETLAEMIGTTRSRVNFFMNKFRDLGFIAQRQSEKLTARCSASFSTISWFAVGVRLGLARPLANHRMQLVRLLLQLPHPLRLHGEVATDFRDLAFNSIR